MTLRRQSWITRDDLQNNRDVVYIFGDNLERKGLGGQAKEMRGETNAYGIATKCRPDNNAGAFFDDNTPDFHNAVEAGLSFIEGLLEHGYDVVIPKDGLGTGLSQLPVYAPVLAKYIETRIDHLYRRFGPKEKGK